MFYIKNKFNNLSKISNLTPLTLKRHKTYNSSATKHKEKRKKTEFQKFIFGKPNIKNIARRVSASTKYYVSNFSPTLNYSPAQTFLERKYYYFGRSVPVFLCNSRQSRFPLYLLRDTCKAGIIKSFTTFQNGTFSRNSTATCT